LGYAVIANLEGQWKHALSIFKYAFMFLVISNKREIKDKQKNGRDK